MRHRGQDRVERVRLVRIDVAPHVAQRRADGADRLLGALGIAAEPEEVVGGAAGQRRARLVRHRLAHAPVSRLTCFSGSVARIHVSFETPPAWFETMTLSDAAAMRVSAPGMTT